MYSYISYIYVCVTCVCYIIKANLYNYIWVICVSQDIFCPMGMASHHNALSARQIVAMVS